MSMHAFADRIIDAHTPVAPDAPRHRRAVHALVDRAVAAGVADEQNVDWLTSTAVLGRHVWLPEQVEPLAAAGLLADDGPVDGFSGRRWYVVAEVPA